MMRCSAYLPLSSVGLMANSGGSSAGAKPAAGDAHEADGTHGRHGRDATSPRRRPARSRSPSATSLPPGRAATLAALPHTTVTVYNEHTKASETYSGVPLIDLLTQARRARQAARQAVPDLPGVPPAPTDTRWFIRMGEITPDVHDATVMVADSENGKPLTRTGRSS